MGGRISLLVLLLCVGNAVSRGIDLQKRIDGGNDCGPNEHPYHVKLVDPDSKLICGGTLIHNKWVLTAAHCLQWKMFAQVPGNPDPKIKIEHHEIFESSNKRKHDIMLLKLSQPVSSNIKPVELPDCKSHPLPGSGDAYLAGYDSARVDATGKRVNHSHLQCALTKIVNCATLETEMKKYTYYLKHDGAYHDQDWKCFNKIGVTTCYGDTGGGVVLKINNKDVIYGVHSFNSELFYCSTAGAFMNICSPDYLKWIRAKI